MVLFCAASAWKAGLFVGKPNHAISEELRLAQERLFERRAALKTKRLAEVSLLKTATGYFYHDQRPFPGRSLLARLPDHLGWSSTPLTRTLRQTVLNVNPQSASPAKRSNKPRATTTRMPLPHQQDVVKVYPDVAIALLRNELVASGRLWLLLRATDSLGRGWIAEQTARQIFTTKRASLRFCGARQLRNLLAQGEGIFWQRHNGRIWLRSVARVAFALDVPRVTLQPVAIPLHLLTQKIGTVRAHLYATFHSSRTKNGQASSPIARETVAQITRVQKRTQRRYERKARVIQHAQFAVGSPLSQESWQTRTWQQGSAVFRFKDFQGKQGRAGRSYVAWQLPNSYVGPHARQPKGSLKRINQALSDLFMQGMTGNGQRSRFVRRRFFGNGRLAAKAHSTSPNEDYYWPGINIGRLQLWQVLEGCQTK